MPLKDFDYLSPKISLFYYGRRRHSAIFGGILTIIMIIICFVYVIYLFLEVYLHTSSTFQYYRHFFKDAGIYSFNNTQGIFHFFQIYNPKNNSQVSFNSKYIRLFMSYIQEEYKTNPELLSENDHWVYDDCRQGIDNKYLSEELFKDIPFTNGLCLRYYYNSNIREYYPKEDIENFIYPNISNLGVNMDNSIGTIIERCNNNSVLTKLFGSCGDEIQIDNYFKNNYGINFNILAHEITPSNYGKQIYNFIYGISNPMKKKKTIETNLIITPLKIDFKGGIFFPKKKQNQTYTLYETYPADEERNENSRVLSIYNFCLTQSGYVFKSSYLTIYDSFPKIGGIIQLIYYIFFGINFIYNRFTIIDDTKKLFFTLHNDEKINGGGQIKKFQNIVKSLRKKHKNQINSIKTIKKISCIEKKDENFFGDSKFNNNIFIRNGNINSNFDSFFKNYDFDNSKSLSIFPFVSEKDMSLCKSNKFLNISGKKVFMENSDIISDKKKNIKIINNIFNDNLDNPHSESKIENKINEIKKDNVNKNNKNNDINELKKSEFIRTKKISQKSLEKNEFNLNVSNNNIIDKVDKEIIYFKILLQKYFHFKRKSFAYESMTVEQIDKYFRFGKYLGTFFCYKKPKNYYLTLGKFRKKLLSEEHFFRTHNYLYLFEKCFDIQESKKIDIVELYKNL